MPTNTSSNIKHKINNKTYQLIRGPMVVTFYNLIINIMIRCICRYKLIFLIFNYTSLQNLND